MDRLEQPAVASGFKPGIIVRLGNLIIIQVVFVFAALALILFVPGSDRETPVRLYEQEQQLVEAAARVSHALESGLIGTDSVGLPDSRFSEYFDSIPVVDRAALVKLTGGDPVRVLSVFERTEAGAGESEAAAVSDFLDIAILRRMAGAGTAESVCPVINGRTLSYYHRVAQASPGETVIIAVAADHALSISSRAGLRYAVLLLFLCAALVSLLTVSLLLRKFKRPLDQIIAGLAETAEGKLHHLTDLERDPELGKLARAYNETTRRLWDDRIKLDSYYRRLESANAELAESRSFLATMIDSSPLSVVVTDSRDNIVLFSRVASSEFGYTPAEIVGRPFSTLLAGKLEGAEVPTAGHGPEGFEVVCRRKDGQSFPAYVVFGAVRNDDGKVLGRLYIGRDITETRNLQDMMIRVDRYYTKGEMVGDIAHEINNYLAVLMGNVELMPLLLKKGDTAKIEKKLEVMKSALEKIARFSDGLLDSPPDAIRIEPTSINQVVETVIGFLKPQNKFDTVEVTAELSPDVSVAHVDSGQIQQLLINLIYNAAEALIDRPEDRQIRVLTAPAEVGGKPGVRVTVSDNGPGVARDKECLLFNTRFTTKRRGHGIGLMTCRKIVDNHDGSIEYRFDDGAVFSVSLPCGCAAVTPENALAPAVAD